ncbi:unnamed protein product [Pleuronectes platessa]|uniref:Uncharacterized protein n=1 Tax=Pleuronectes platessa TaxID=8262 RepID=A0A9N7USI1_PLEPL|nr:unnamed protein product [Pleuronectes platessa]
MEVLVRLFPFAKTIAGMRQACEHGQRFKDSSAARARRNLADPMPWSSSALVMIRPGCGSRGGDPCCLFQTQAAQTVLQSRVGPAMPRMAFLLGLMGVGVSGYSSRQLTLHYKPASNLFR